MLFRSVLGCLLAAFSLVACSAPPSLFDPPKENYLRIGVKYDQPGTGYFEHDKYSGFDVDLAYWLARELGQTPILINVSSDSRDAGLKAEPRRRDMVIASYSILGERERGVDFVGPYIITLQGVMVRKADDRGIRELADLSGKTACTAEGTTSYDQLAQQSGNTGIIPTTRVDFSQCVEALRNGEVDAMSTDQMILYGFAQKYPEFEVVPGLTMGSLNKYGVAIPEGYPEDCAKIREEVRRFVTSSEWQALFEQHLGSIPDPENYKPKPEQIDKYSCNPDSSPG